ncbi:hypothetical protein DAPPUDRAFT_333657 [Daphnia pulex]|uniref:Uncharacterized protein n=1 Tax=Daphnia pulex TaxID=6669 RepID=E9HTH1_DAPPU|nr:hypothetical protein DAPPUDRAFT_333657 [Daphnia pulex]|eukprot:EFX64951.1 hypothetical protein DAPPUDRAFT_333657 [Daphnia pulex]
MSQIFSDLQTVYTRVELFIMNFKVFSILAMVALVFVFMATADPAPEEHVTEGAAHFLHGKMVKDAEKHEPSMDPYLDETKYHHIPIIAPKGAIISCTIQNPK